MQAPQMKVVFASLASLALGSTPWGIYDGNGGMADGHYCVENSDSPPTDWSFVHGHWFGLSWAKTNPEKDVYDFKELDAYLQEAVRRDRYVEVNALVGQCSPDWIYSHGVTALIVNWKPPPSCVPPICVPAGTWDCSEENGQGCGCDGVPCNQTFPDYLSPVYNEYLTQWIRASHDHILRLPPALRERVVSVQANAGSTGDGCAYHGRLWPEQREAGYGKIEDKKVFEDYYLDVMKRYVDIYNTSEASESIPLLFNDIGDQNALHAYLAHSGQGRYGYMVKFGSVSHDFFVSWERLLWNTSRLWTQSRVPEGDYVRSRGESTLTMNVHWVSHPHWTSWALASWILTFGLDTWQNVSLIEEQPRMRPALAFYEKYAGTRRGSTSPGAWAVLRDGLDAADTERWSEEKFGPTKDGSNVDRCLAVLNDVAQKQTNYPPKQDAPSADGCGVGRRPGMGLNDVGFEVHRENYGQFLEQIDPELSSLGAWRIGPVDEIFGRYGRTVHGEDQALSFRVLDGVFGEQPQTVYARVVFFDAESGISWRLAYSDASGCVDAGASAIVGKGSGHWVEVRLTLTKAKLLATGSCGNRKAAVLLKDLGDSTKTKPTVFNLVEMSKVPFDIALSPWQLNGDEVIDIIV